MVYLHPHFKIFTIFLEFYIFFFCENKATPKLYQEKLSRYKTTHAAVAEKNH